MEEVEVGGVVVALLSISRLELLFLSELQKKKFCLRTCDTTLKKNCPHDFFFLSQNVLQARKSWLKINTLIQMTLHTAHIVRGMTTFPGCLNMKDFIGKDALKLI